MKIILCIDDDESTLMTLCALLSGAGYRFVGANTPIQARARFITDRPDLVIVDHGLPGEDGDTLAQNLKRIRNIPVLMLTGRAEMQVSGNIDKLLIKPQEPKAILSAIAELLQQ